MINSMFEYFKMITIALLLCVIWQALELWLLGEINPDKVDLIMCLVLTYSLHLNLKLMKKGN